jgi:hypothetical protein
MLIPARPPCIHHGNRPAYTHVQRVLQLAIIALPVAAVTLLLVRAAAAVHRPPPLLQRRQRRQLAGILGAAWASAVGQGLMRRAG